MRKKGRITVTAWMLGGIATNELTATLEIRPVYYFKMGVEAWATPTGEPLDLPLCTLWVRAEKPMFQVTLAKLALGDRFTLTGDVRELITDNREHHLNAAITQIKRDRKMVRKNFDRWVVTYSHAGPHGREPAWLSEKQGYLRGVINEFVAGNITLYAARMRVMRILAPYPQYARDAAARLFDHQQRSYDRAMMYVNYRLHHHFTLEHLHHVTRTHMGPSKSIRLDRVDHAKMQQPVYWQQVVRQLATEARWRRRHGLALLPLTSLMGEPGKVKWQPSVPEV